MTDLDPLTALDRALFDAYKKYGAKSWRGNEYYHYTDLSGLVGIVERKELWLSDHRFLNDSMEYLHGKEIATRMLDHFAARERRVGIREILLASRAMLELNQHRVFYIASMSKAKDSLDQWKGYGGNAAGICIALGRGPELGEVGLLRFAGYSLRALEVIYAEKDKNDKIGGTIRSFCSSYSSAPSEEKKGLAEVWAVGLASAIQDLLITFKHEEYASEREVRLVAASSMVDNRIEVKHRVSRGRIVPYISSRGFGVESDKLLPIKGVIVGPVISQAIVAASIEVFLHNKGYFNVSVERSVVPYRG